jgi:hypothetical protein
MRFIKLGDAAVNLDRVLCIQPEGMTGDKDALAVTYDTGQVVYISDKEPSATLKSYFESLGSSVASPDSGTI